MVYNKEKTAHLGGRNMEYAILGLLILVAVLLIVLLVRSFSDRRFETEKELRLEQIRGRERYEELRDAVRTGNDRVMESLSQNNEKVLRWQTENSESVRAILTDSLTKLQESNERKLEQMRCTVGEKLDETLTKRLDTSFQTVTEQLVKVYQALGEMKELSSGVSDLQRLLTNVKARGTWAEVQLGEILEQFLTRDQFVRNVSIRKNREMVEYAVCIPSRDGEGTTHLLPIDSKFPLDAYEHIQQAAETGNPALVEEACKGLENAVRLQAKKISELYIDVPTTTDFAILFLPTEGLYAEVLRCPGLSEDIQNRYRVMICGPTTIAAFLSTVKVGFRTLALDRQASEVWKVLSATRQQYEKFTEALGRAKKKIDEAGRAIEDAQTRNDQISKRLKKVDTLPESEAERLLGLTAEDEVEPVNDEAERTADQ